VQDLNEGWRYREVQWQRLYDLNHGRINHLIDRIPMSQRANEVIIRLTSNASIQ